MFQKLIDYLKGTKSELKQVNWPTRRQTLNFTFLVIGISLLVAAILGGADKLFSFLIQTLIFHG